MEVRQAKLFCVVWLAVFLAACSQNQVVPPLVDADGVTVTSRVDVVISQIYGAGGNSGAVLQDDYVELFNRGIATASLDDLSLQYTSATGSGSFGANGGLLVALSDVMLEPGQYFLIKLAGGANGAALPEADVEGTINMSAASGKVALVSGTASLGCNGGSTPCSEEQLSRIIDLVGYGNANFYEGEGAAPAISATTAAFRNGAGCTDTNDNRTDFETGAPAPRNSSSPFNLCDAEEKPPVDEEPPVEDENVVVAWTFEGATAEERLEPSAGEGAISSGPGLSGPTWPQGTGGSGTYALSHSNWALTSTLDTQKYVQFALSTAGSAGISLSFDANRSGTGPRTFEVHYSLDGSSFVQLPVSVTPVPTDGWENYSLDFSSVEVLDNRTALTLRIYGYGATGTGGTWRFDNVTFTAAATTNEPPIGKPPVEEPPVDEEPPVEGEPEVCGDPFTPIYSLSGTGSKVVTEGIVTADFRGGLNGFYIQDPEGDENPTTSDGIFVYTPAASEFSRVSLTVGDAVRVRAETDVFRGVRQLTWVESILLCESDEIVTPTALSLPVDSLDDFEPYIGMLVSLPQTDIAVTELYQLGRFGEFSVAAGGRLFHPNNGNVAGDPQAIRDLNDRSRIIIDDGSTAQNPFPTPYLGRNGVPRVGDKVENIVGVLTYAFNAYRIHPTAEPQFTDTNPRTQAPAPVGGDIKVASFNVLNYFTTFQPRSYARGAQNDAEFARQRAKLIAAIQAIDADVVGLIEMENNGYGPNSAIQDLVSGLNDAYGAEVYAVVPDPYPIGTDAIKQALIYKPGKVELLNVTSDANPVHHRPPVVGTFRQQTSPYGVFSVAVVHHKSKRCSTGWQLDPETMFEGCFDRLRTQQSLALREFIAELKEELGDEDFLIVGDFNAYNNENPITSLTVSGLENLTLRIPDEDRYSYVFDGESGTLDYAMATSSFADQVTGVTIWHINPDEPVVLQYDQVQYNTQYDRYHDNSPFRSSDHDPVIVGLELLFNPSQVTRMIAEDVQALVEAGALTPDQGVSLMEKLDSAISAIGRENETAALGALRAFVRQVRGFVRADVLSPEDGQALIALADEVVDALR